MKERKRVRTIKFLRVLFDGNLTWNDHLYRTVSVKFKTQNHFMVLHVEYIFKDEFYLMSNF